MGRQNAFIGVALACCVSACGGNTHGSGSETSTVEDADGSTGEADDDDAPASPEPSFCDGRVCGADYETGEFCGMACSDGQGCTVDGQCGAWPPHLDSIYNGSEAWQLPPCSPEDDPGGILHDAAEGWWIKTMTTTGTDCGSVVQEYHPMSNIGNVATEDTSVPVYGSCVMYVDGQWGTARDGVVVWGQSWNDKFHALDYMISWRAIVDHNLTPPSGVGVAHITRLGPGLDCSIEFELTYERCPEHRDDCGQHPKPW